MASDLEVPQTALLVGTPDSTLTDTSSDNLLSSALSPSSPLLNSSRLPTSPSPSDNHGSPCSPTPILRSARYSLGSIRWASSTALCDNNPEGRDGSTSYLAPNPHDRELRTGSSTERKTERTPKEDPRFKLPSWAAHPDWTGARPSATLHVNASLGTSAGSRPSFVTNFFRRTVRRVRRPSGESDTSSDKGSDTAQNGDQKGDNLNVRRKETQLVVFDPKPQRYSDLGVFQKQSIMDNREERLEVTKKLHGEAVDLQTFYESGTVAAMRNLRATGKAVTCCLQKQNIETLGFSSTPAATSTGQCRIQRGGLRVGRNSAALRGIKQILERGDSPCR